MGDLYTRLKQATEPSQGTDLSFSEFSGMIPVFRQDPEESSRDISTFLKQDFRENPAITIDASVLNFFWSLSQKGNLNQTLLSEVKKANELRRALPPPTPVPAQSAAPQLPAPTSPPPSLTPRRTPTGTQETSVSPDELLQRSGRIQTEIGEMTLYVTALAKQAQKEQDIIRLAAINDSLIELRVLSNLMDQTLQNLRRAVVEKDEPRMTREFARITVIYQRVTVFVQQAENAAAEELALIVGDSEIETFIDDPLLLDDPTQSDLCFPDQSPLAARPYSCWGRGPGRQIVFDPGALWNRIKGIFGQGDGSDRPVFRREKPDSDLPL